jgi:hypothetical protein
MLALSFQRTQKQSKQTYDSSKMNAFLAVVQPEDIDQYRSVSHRFMAYKQGRPITFSPTGRVQIEAFPKDHVFTNAELTNRSDAYMPLVLPYGIQQGVARER